MARSRPQVTKRRQYSQSLPAPLGGINARDALQSMPVTDALELVNWVAQQYGARVRKGWAEWGTGYTAPVRTLMTYQPNRENLATFKLFAVTDAGIYDATVSSGTPVVSLALPGTDNYGYFSDTQYTNAGGSFLLTCSHEGGYRYYNGTTWSTPTAGAGAGQINGIDPSNLVFVTTWKRRVWFIEKNSSNAWYLPTDAITGTAAKIELGQFFTRGGKLSFIATWTIDAGEGIDDFIVFGSENGEILVYKGTDPTNAATFAKVGTYYVGALPVGRRAFTDFGGDLLVLSELGIQPLSYVTRGGQSLLRASSVDYLAKIQPRLAELVAQYANTRGWAMTYFPRESFLIVDVPVGATTEYQQYVLYTNTNTWSQFKGIPSNGSTCVANNQLYFGTDDGRVCLAYTGYFDAVPRGSSTGNGIYGKIQPAYSYFNMPGMNKQFLMVRPNFLATDRPSVVPTMLVDFQTQSPMGTPIATAPAGALWDVSLWDQAIWAGALQSFNDWYGVEGMGYAGSLMIDTVCPGDTFLASIDYSFEPGGVL